MVAHLDAKAQFGKLAAPQAADVAQQESPALAVDAAHMMAIVSDPEGQHAWNLKALDLVDWGKMRYNLLGNGGHWFPGAQLGETRPADLAKVLGRVVATRKEPLTEGWKLLVVRQLDAEDKETGGYVVAADAVGAGVGEVVLYASGSSARNTETTKDKPCDAVIMAIVDQWERIWFLDQPDHQTPQRVHGGVI